MDKKVIILGLGFVGQANAVALTRMGYDVYAKDIQEVKNIYETKDFDRIKIFKELSESFIKPEDKVPVIVCVNAYNGSEGQDLESVKSALSDARKITKGMVILRTTVVPQCLKSLDFDLYLPEFLHERTALQEVQFPEMLVLGFKDKSAEQMVLPKFISDWQQYVKHVPTRKFLVCSAEEGAYIKYLLNIWNSLRIAFVNEYGRAIINDGLTLNHEKIIDFVMDRAYYLRYGKAFGGHCLCKDTEGFYDAHTDMKILENLILSNKEHEEFVKNREAKELFYGD